MRLILTFTILTSICQAQLADPTKPPVSMEDYLKEVSSIPELTMIICPSAPNKHKTCTALIGKETVKEGDFLNDMLVKNINSNRVLLINKDGRHIQIKARHIQDEKNVEYKRGKAQIKL